VTRIGLVFVLAWALGCEPPTPRCPRGMSVRGDRCICDAPRFVDLDGDGYGSGERLDSCALGDGIVEVDGDCDDDDETRHPGAPETCNGVDDDCDGIIDDGFPCARGADVACTTTCGSQGTLACTDGCTLPEDALCEPPAERCNGVDDDCDGAVDEGVRELTWLGMIDPGATVEASVLGMAGGMIVTARGATGGTLHVLDTEGARARSDRSLDHHVRSPLVRRRGGELVLRGVYTAPPTRPYCGALGSAPDFALSAGFCAGELDASTELFDVLADGLYEVWLARVNGEVHAGIVNFGPATLAALTVDGEPLTGERAFGVSHLERFIVETEGVLRVYRRHQSEPSRYVPEVSLGNTLASGVKVVDDDVVVAQAQSTALVVRRFHAPFTCANPSLPLGACVHALAVADVFVAGRSAISVEYIDRQTFVAYTKSEGTELGLLELDQDDDVVNHVSFGEAQGPFAEVFAVDVGEALPRVLARASSGAMHLYSPECAP
jgi:hypothetical protein